jgi:hypothetical protein
VEKTVTLGLFQLATKNTPPSRNPAHGADGPASGRWSAEVSRAVREALEAVATPEVAGRMLFEALSEARLSALPEQHDDLRSFVEVELAQVIHDTLGPDAYGVVHERVELVLRVLSRIELHKSDRQKSTRPPARPTLAGPTSTSDTRPPPPSPIERSRPGIEAIDANREPSWSSLPSVPSLERWEGKVRGDATLQAPLPLPRADAPRADRATLPPGPPGISPSASASPSTRVVLVTADARLGSSLRVRLGASATVLTYRTMVELSRSPIGTVHLLLLDVRDLSRDTELAVKPGSVLLWPASVTERDRFASKHPHLADIRFAGHDASAEDIASVISLILTPR